jgi:hypothetical protein
MNATEGRWTKAGAVGTWVIGITSTVIAVIAWLWPHSPPTPLPRTPEPNAESRESGDFREAEELRPYREHLELARRALTESRESR